MAAKDAFQNWLRSQGLRVETAQAVITDLGIESKEVLRACTETDSVKAELFSFMKQKFPFAMYAEVRSFVKSFWEPQVVRPAGPALVDVLCSMLKSVSWELSNCAQKLSFLDSPTPSNEVDNGPLENTVGVFGIKISDVCSLHPEEERVNLQFGEEEPVEIVHSQFNLDAPSDETLICEDEQRACEALAECSNPEFPTVDFVVGVKQEADMYSSMVQEELVETAYFEGSNIAPTSHEALNTHLVNQDTYIAPQESSNSSEQTAVKPADIGKLLKPNSIQVLNKKGNLKKQAKKRTKMSSKYQCTYCQYSNKLKSRLSKHMKLHTSNKNKKGQKNKKCEKIDTAEKIDTEKNDTEKNDTGEENKTAEKDDAMVRPFKCSVCLKAFANSSGVKSHMRTHTGERPYRCSICDKAFTQSGNLLSHVRIHTGERPYKCSVCGKDFIQSGNLVVHMKIHKGNRPHKCPLCGKGFVRSYDMKSHMKTHTFVHPYKCFICGKTFRYSGSMAVHMRTHAGPEKVTNG